MSLIKITASLFLLFILLAYDVSAQMDTVSAPVIEDTSFVMTKSPWTAVLLSAAIPGLGQIYNESYIKAAAFWGVGAWLVYNWINSDNDYKFYQDLYTSGVNPERSANYLRLRDISRDNRDMFSIYLVLTYVLNLVDAYVDAHLFDFSVEEDFYTRQALLKVKLKF